MQTASRLEKSQGWKIKYDSDNVVIVSKKVLRYLSCAKAFIDGHVFALTPCPKASTGLVAIQKIETRYSILEQASANFVLYLLPYVLVDLRKGSFVLLLIFPVSVDPCKSFE